MFRMKVLYLASVVEIPGARYGGLGGTSHVIEVSQHLQALGFEVTIQKWLRKSEQGDKWNRCLIEGMIVLSETGARDEQTTPP